MSSSSIRISVGHWALAMGATGFAAGFFGPMMLNPDANQGPMVGIFITGPGGALAGLVLGLIFKVLDVSDAQRVKTLALCCMALVIGTLYFCLPEPAVRGYVVDADVDACMPPIQAAEEALSRWERAVANVTWATPPQNWKETAVHHLERDEGVVLTMRVARRAAIYEHRKPWNRGRINAGPWVSADKSERYYARDDGSSCDAYLSRSRTLYWPSSDASSRPNVSAQVWPPTDTLGFLQLLELRPVPAQYRALLR